jgi:hypothetical protein
MLESLASLGTVPDGMADKLAGPKRSIGLDGVHLTDFGFNNLFWNMSQTMGKILDRMSKTGKEEKGFAAPILVSGGFFYRRRFTSPAGSIQEPPTTSMNIRSRLGGQSRGSEGHGF